MRAVRSVAVVGVGLVFLLAAGCGAGPKDLQIEALQNEVNKLQGEKQDLLSKLTRAISERDAALARARDLEAQLAGLKPEGKKEGRWEEFPGIAWTDIADNILFDSGKADLKAAGRTELQTVLAEARQKFPGRQIWIIGHTDGEKITKSKWKDNLELSVQRACTVFREMQKLGVDPGNMVAAGQGEFNPKVANDPRTGRARENRRVQIVALEVPRAKGGLEESGERG